MKVASEWLNEFLSTEVSAPAMAEALEKAGIEIEQIISSIKLDKKIVVGFVKKVVQHPDADKLKVLSVDVGDQGVKEIVCGAPNVRTGLTVAVALPGSALPNGHRIERAVIRGQKSDGMICSANELGVSDDHTGILELGGELAAGRKLCDIWPESEILDIKTAANRPDLQSVRGLAREVAAQKGLVLKEEPLMPWPGKSTVVSVVVSEKALTPRYIAGDLLIDIEAATPKWMVERLESSGVRPINVVVDVTNYVMLETGQPLHAFDATKVKLPISVRLAEKGEQLLTLDRVERALSGSDLVIADELGPIALAGVMGGARTEVSMSTKRIILEAATFDGPSIRKTAKRHGLRTEASARFERRLPVQSAEAAIRRAAGLLADLARAKPAGALNDQLHIWPWVQHIGVRSSKLTKLFGKELSRQAIAKSLERLGFEAEVFDIAKEARKHLGKPYVWGAKFKTDGAEAFDCSYFVDYVYSLVGVMPGHTAMAQYEYGRPVHTGELKPGDVLFRGGPWVKLKAEERKGVSHNVIYIGDGKVIHPRDYTRSKQGDWERMPEGERKVVEEPSEVVLNDPQYLGARRYVEDLDDFVAVTVPWWRPDVRTEEDVLEEVARIVGYNSLPATLPPWRPANFEPDRRWPLLWRLKNAMRGQGLFEVMTYAFVSGEQLDRLGLDKKNHLKVKNPLSIEQEYLRSSLLPSLLMAVSKNVNYAKEFGMFELSKVFEPTKLGELPHESPRIAVIQRRPDGAYLEVKSALDLLEREFGLNFEIRQVKIAAGLHPHFAAEVFLGGRAVGVIGEVHPGILREYKVPGSVAYLEVDWEALASSIKGPEYRHVSKFPPAYRDLSILVKTDTAWQEIRNAVNELGVGRVEFLSDYYGNELPAGCKALALRLEMSSMDSTLTDNEADVRLAKVMKALEKKVAARPRT
jgi:phenylalanyl-tRNA synthetase beta subunit